MSQGSVRSSISEIVRAQSDHLGKLYIPESSVQLKLEFLLPESVQEAARIAQEIHCLPNDHHAKLNMLEVEKICLYAVSSAIRETQKITLDPNLNLDNKFKDRNLTQAVSENLARVSSNKLQVVS